MRPATRVILASLLLFAAPACPEERGTDDLPSSSAGSEGDDQPAERPSGTAGAGPAEPAATNSITMLLNGEPWTSIEAEVSGWPPAVITATDSTNPGRGLTLLLGDLTGPGTYSLSGSSWAAGSGMPQDIYVVSTGAATAEITTLTDDRLTGTFELSLRNANGTATAEITEGLIDVGPP